MKKPRCFSLIGICFLIGIRSFKSIPSKHLFIAFGTSLVLFIVGISSSAVAGINFAKSMASYGEIEKEVASFNGNNLTIIPQLSKRKVLGGYTVNSEDDESESRSSGSSGSGSAGFSKRTGLRKGKWTVSK